MTMEGVVLGKQSNNAGIWLGKAGVVETVKVEREMSALTKPDLEIICQKVVAETLREDEFSFQLHPNEQLSFD